MQYSKIFAPPELHRLPEVAAHLGLLAADKRGAVYFFQEKLILAINVAIVSGRPLLLLGPPGTGKSTVARHIAHGLGWRYLSETITTQTRSLDLLYRLDLLKRLYDANTREANTEAADIDQWKRYITPGILWKAFDPIGARELPLRTNRSPQENLSKEQELMGEYTDRQGQKQSNGIRPAVVLLDELDKADPDIPNNLLHPLGRLEFDVLELEKNIAVAPELAPLIIMTSNEERSLPDAIIRRCVVFRLSTPSQDDLVRLAGELFSSSGLSQSDRQLCEHLARRFMEICETARGRKPGTAEYLDAVEIALRWRLEPTSPELEQLLAVTVEKNLHGGMGVS